MAQMSQQEFLAWADQYLRLEMDIAERIRFEQFCAEHPNFDQLFQQHQSFVQDLQKSHVRATFKKQLQHEAKAFHFEQEKKIIHKTKVISLWQRLRLNAAVAAAIAIVSVFSTLYLSGYYQTLKKTSSDYSALRRDVNNVKKNVYAHQAAIKNINTKNANDEMHYGATGFMLTKDGYVVTNYHVINGADSVHLQNNKGQAYRASIIYTDAAKDLAILHISDSSFRTLKNVPYTFKRQDSDLGEDIYTLGFPRDEAVYGQGYLSSSTGYAGDTLAYQISIPVNPGNSGGPVLDKQGNIIGIISGKQKGIDGAAFAIKTKALLETLNQIPASSLQGNVVLNNKNSFANLSRTEQIKRLQDYVYIVKVY